MGRVVNPDQPVVWASDGCIRLKKNKIVDKLLNFATENGYSLNDICMEFDVQLTEPDNDDYTQLMQLIGYSVSGYGDLSTSPPDKVKKFDDIAEKMSKREKYKKAEEVVHELVAKITTKK